MAAGAFLAYKIATNMEGMPIVLVILAGASVPPRSVLLGLPSLRIKGFYLAVTTLAAQFFCSGCSRKFRGS